MSRSRQITFAVPPSQAGRRLDQVLAASIDGLSRGRARGLIDVGGVFVDGRRVKIASRPLRAGQQVQVTIGGSPTPGPAHPGALAIVYEDDALVVVDKPSGLPVAATATTDRGHLLDVLTSAGRRGASLRLVHRLDVPTSGLLVVAKTPDATRHLARQFAAHTITREYLAVLLGSLPTDATVTRPIGGRHATTHFAIDRSLGDRATCVRCRLETGRTHQIRIHAAHLGHPVAGDRLHGRPAAFDPPRLALHATRLGFVHPTSKERSQFESPWPSDMAAWIDGLEVPGPRLPNPSGSL